MIRKLKTRHLLLRWCLVLLFVSVCVLFAGRLKVRQNVQDMLPDSIAQGDMRLLSRLGLINRVFITVEGPDFAAVSGSTRSIGELLSRDACFSRVIYRIPVEMDSGMLAKYLSLLPVVMGRDDLLEVKKQLSPAGISAALHEDFLLLNSPAGIGIKSFIRQDPLGLSRIFLKKLEILKNGSRMKVRDGLFSTEDGRACMLWAESRDALTDSATAEQVQAVIDAALRQGLLEGTEATVIGTLPHTLANSRMVSRDLKLLLTLATAAIIILFWVFTRNFKSLVLVMIPLMSAPCAILAAGVISGGSISGIALGFGIVLMGIAVDFAVHIYMRLECGVTPGAVHKVYKMPVMRSLIMAYLTTAGVFAVLLLSRIPAHRQMALMALVGLTLALIFSLLLVPGIAPGHERDSGPVGAYAFFAPERRMHCLYIIILWILITLAGIISWTRISYNGDIRRFDIRTGEIEAAERHFQMIWGADTDRILVVAASGGLDRALDLNDRVYSWLEQHGIKDIKSISSILPGPEKQRENIIRWNDFIRVGLPDIERDITAAASAVGFSNKAFTPFLQWLRRPAVPLRPDEFLSSSLGGMLSGMVRIADSNDISGQSVPDALVVTMVADTPGLAEKLHVIRDDLPGVHLFSGSGWKLEMEAMMKADIRNLCLGALMLVSLIVWLFFRDLRMVAGALVPVVSALSVMALFTAVSTGEFNMMHLLMGIMVTGLSIDYGIFMACAMREEHAASTARAVILCALSTLSGFGILVLAHHPVLKSLGETVLVGIGAALPAALLVTPCVVGYNRNTR